MAFLALPLSKTPPALPHRAGPTLRRLAVGTTVAALHLLLLWSGWHGSPPDQAAPTLPEGASYIPVTMLASSAPPKPPAPRRAPGTRPTVSNRPVAMAPAASLDDPLPEAEIPAPPAQESAATTPADDSPPAVSPPASEPEPAATAVLPPAPMRLNYVVEGQARGLGYSASAVLDWRQDGERYEARMEISAFLLGSRSQASSGRLGTDGLRPERFVDRARRERVTVFDQAAGQLYPADGGASLALTAGTQDKLSVFVQLAAQLAALPQPPDPGESLLLPVAASAAIESWRFRFEGIEEQTLPAGRYPSWKFSRAPLHEGEATLELWMAPALAFLPVRIHLRQDNGDSVDQRLSRP